MIIGLTGYAESGKDEVAKILISDFGFTRIAFADGVREVALAIDPFISASVRLSAAVELYGWDTAKTNPEVRRLLQKMGTEAVRDIIGQDTWIKLALKKAANLKHTVFTDVRFPNEAEALCYLKSEDAALLWRIHRPGHVTKVGKGHPSEAHIDSFKVDKEIFNTGSLQELRDTVRDQFA